MSMMSVLLRSIRTGSRSFSKRSICSYSPASRRMLFPIQKRGVFSSRSTVNLPRQFSSTHPGPEVTFSPEQLLEALEKMVESSESLPPVPPEQEQECFWRAYLLANQVIMYLAARSPEEAEAFAAIFQSAAVPENSPVARGRTGVSKITKQIVNTISAIPPDSSLRSSHPEVFQAFERLRKVYDAYVTESGEKKDDLESWSRFFVGLRTELVEFTARIGMVVEGWEGQE